MKQEEKMPDFISDKEAWGMEHRIGALYIKNGYYYRRSNLLKGFMKQGKA